MFWGLGTTLVCVTAESNSSLASMPILPDMGGDLCQNREFNLEGITQVGKCIQFSIGDTYLKEGIWLFKVERGYSVN